MAAELVVSTTAVPVRTDGTTLVGPDHREALHARIDAVLAAAPEPVLAGAAEIVDPFGEEEGERADVLRAALYDASDRLFSSVTDPDAYPWPRDVVELAPRGGGLPMLLTGGMTWGDDPTDSFGDFEVLNTLSPFEAPFRVEATDGGPALRVRITEQVSYTVHVPLTDDILDDAQRAGYSRDVDGVADLLVDDVDHSTLVDLIDPTAPDGVEEREVTVYADALDAARSELGG